ncbi:MAG TPA: protease complex subunit PrcB family protein [Planctomycetota bacterium]|nr:protease complex subunit PrcB family protein [Planctomycetota bacterium]
MHWSGWVGAAVVLSIVLVACRREPLAEPQDPIYEGGTAALMRVLQGANSGVDCQELVVCRDSATFAELWARHGRLQMPAPSMPELDFDHFYAVCLFGGSRPSGGYSVTIEGLEPTKDGVRVLAHEEEPEPGSAQITMMTAPFEIVAVPQFEGTAELVWTGN